MFRNKHKNILVIFLLCLSISVLVVPITIRYCWKVKSNPFFIEIKSGITGTISIEDERVNLAYSKHKSNGGNSLGWTRIRNRVNGIKLQNFFNCGNKRSIGDFSKVVGITGNDGWYYIFANGIDSFFDPGVMGQRTQDFKNWFPVPSFPNNTNSLIYQKFFGYDFDSKETLYCCFSDYQGMIMGHTNYSFYFLQIDDDHWNKSNITFQGKLEYYIKSQYCMFKNRHAILWNYYNESIDLIELHLAIQLENYKWQNYTISLPQKDLNPIGFEKTNQNLQFYFYGLNYYGENNSSNYKITSIYSAEIIENKTEYNLIYSYPSRIYINNDNIHNWHNGSFSLFFSEHNNVIPSLYYGILTGDKLIKSKVCYNSSFNDFYALQMLIKEEIVYLVWSEAYYNSGEFVNLYNLYILRFHANGSLESALEATKQVIEWIEEVNTTSFEFTVIIFVIFLIRKRKRRV